MAGSIFRLAIAATALAIAGPALADVKTGVDAWFAGRYGDAVRTWRPMADKGDADAQFNMGQAYRLGRGVPADMKIAQSWFQKAAAQGHAEAQANLGLILYQNGEKKAAMPFIRRAAERGDERAQYVLGATLFNGDVEGRDWPRAYALMTLAADKGLPSAQTSLKQMDEAIPAADKERGRVLAREMTTSIALASNTRLRPSSPPASGVRNPHNAPTGGAKMPPPAAKDTPGGRAAAAASQAAKMEPPARRGVSALPKPAPTPTPTPVAAASPAPARPSAGGNWRIQLGAYNSPAAARSQWGVLSKKVGMLGTMQPSYEPAGKFTRLRTGPFGSRAEAEKACAAARSAGQACFAVAG
jgi:TPR repeat protein